MILVYRKFRVYPVKAHEKPRSLFWDVLLFDTRESMQAYYQEYGGTDDVAAVHCPMLCKKVSKSGKERLLPKLGELLFYVDSCGGGIVSHEFFHAVLWWARRAGLKFRPDFWTIHDVDEAEETLCQVHGSLVSQFYVGFYKHCKKVIVDETYESEY